MIYLTVADESGLDWAQQQVAAHHYLHTPVDSRCAPLAYEVWINADPKIYGIIGYLIFGRPEATRCYDGKLTYGSLKDVRSGRAQYDRWEILNLARVWLHPRTQQPGQGLYHPKYL